MTVPRATPLIRLLRVCGLGVVLSLVGTPWYVVAVVMAAGLVVEWYLHRATGDPRAPGWQIPLPTTHFVASGVFAFILFLTARTTGAGWLIVLVCIIVSVMVVGAVLPVFALLRLRPRLHGPRDVTADEPFHMTIGVARAGLGLIVQVLDGASPPAVVFDREAPVGPLRADRGVIREMTVLIASTAPLTMMVVRRRLQIVLDHPVHVAPKVGRAHATATAADAAEGGSTGGQAAHGDRLRSVREYVSGDALRLVHWPVTARRGALVVKEPEGPAAPDLHLVVPLSGVREADDAVCEDAMATVVAALDEGRRVTLYTNDGTSGCVTRVRDRRDAGRALATAGPGRPADPGIADGVVLRLPGSGSA